MKYKVLKKFDKYKPGDIVSDEERYIRRKIAEGGGCLEKLNEKSIQGAPKNKAMTGAPKNKGGSA